MNEVWHLTASALAVVASSLVGVLYHLYSGRLDGVEESQEKFEEETGDDITAIRERLATLEERSRWNGSERRGRAQ